MQVGQIITGKTVYRSETGQECDFTPLQIINYEADILGNYSVRTQALQACIQHNLDLSTYGKGDAIWITFDPKVAEDYILVDSDSEDGELVDSWQCPSETIILASDGDDGYLILEKH